MDKYTFDLETRTLVFGQQECINCNPRGSGKRWGRITCPKCNGTGRGVRGGKGGCTRCHGFKETYSETNLVDCYCVTQYNTPTLMPVDFMTSIDLTNPIFDFKFVVIRQQRDASWNEQYLGMGSLWSSINYGESNDWTDEHFIEAVKSSSSMKYMQICKVGKESEDKKSAVIASTIGIFTNYSGYAVKAVFDDNSQ